MIAFGMGKGQCGRGRPRMRWIDEIIKTTGLNIVDLVGQACNRKGQKVKSWR